MSWHPKESGLFRYATKHEARHARALMSKNNPSARVGEVVESPMPANQVFPCPMKGKPAECQLAKET
jgi:hypothetical protein